MPFNDAFGFFGHYAFSSKPTHGRSIYESMSEGMGDSYNQDFNGLNSARLYANAICMATAQYQIDRAFNNRDVSKATEMIGELEKDYQVTPGPSDTLKQRRDFLSAIIMVSKGNSQGVVERALRTVLGTDFISYTHLDTVPWPVNPNTTSVFGEPGKHMKQFTLDVCIATTDASIQVPYTLVGDSEPPIAGEMYTIDPDPRKTIEVITIESADSSYFTATFKRSHEPKTVAITPYPFWSSERRYSTVVVSLAASQDPEKRRKVNELMSKISRGVSQWAIVSDQGSFVLDSSTSGLLSGTVLS